MVVAKFSFRKDDLALTEGMIIINLQLLAERR